MLRVGFEKKFTNPNGEQRPENVHILVRVLNTAIFHLKADCFNKYRMKLSR